MSSSRAHAAELKTSENTTDDDESSWFLRMKASRAAGSFARAVLPRRKPGFGSLGALSTDFWRAPPHGAGGAAFVVGRRRASTNAGIASAAAIPTRLVGIIRPSWPA